MKMLFFFLPVIAAPAAAEPWFKPLIDTRLRYENVDENGLAQKADALTARVRAGVDARIFEGVHLLVEGEGTLALVGDFNSSVNGKTAFPVVADPENVEINRLQFQTTLLPRTIVTIGRQRIMLDDHRFVGNSGWRQNEQTFDALRIATQAIPGLTADLTYAWSTRTIFGVDSPIYSIGGDNILANVGLHLPLGVLTGFGYWIDQDHPARVQFSSKTFGMRFAGKQAIAANIGLSYVLSYARQSNAFANPRDYRADYWLADAGLSFDALTLGAGYEILGADDGRPFTSFQTPLATLHKFQGWADKFPATPANGIRDLYGSIAYTWADIGPFDDVTITAVYHELRSERANQNYGDEFNLQFQARSGKFTYIAKYADYDANALMRDTRKLWLSVEYAH